MTNDTTQNEMEKKMMEVMMPAKKRIHMHLSWLDNNVQLCALRNIRGMAYKVPIGSIAEFLKNQNKRTERTEYCIDKACVYIIFGNKVGDINQKVIYIGETDNVATRFSGIKRNAHHMLRKTEYEWQDLIIFCRTDYDFNKGHITHIERKLMLLANNRKDIMQLSNIGKLDENGDITTKNKTNIERTTLSVADRDVADDFIDSIKILTKVLGHDLFDPEYNNNPHQTEISSPRFFLRHANRFDDCGQYIGDGFIVLRGTKISMNENSTSDSPICEEVYDFLHEKKILGDDNKLKEDYKFEDSATAASVILDEYIEDGDNIWETPLDSNIEPSKCEKWETLREWLEKQ